MEEKIVIRVDMEDPGMKNLERLNLEANARMSVLNYLLNSAAPMDQEAFDRYHSEYVKYYAEYRKAMDEFAVQFKLDQYGQDYMWSVNFTTHEIEITRRA